MSIDELSVEVPFRVLAEVTFHYSYSRLQYLFQVVRALSEFPVEVLDIVIVTNVADEEKIKEMSALCAPLLQRHPFRPNAEQTVSFATFPDLADPWHLPWCHKPLITERFLGAKTGYTHYIHLEDDIRLSFDNFCYFVHFSNLLRDLRLIPSFQRVEFNTKDNQLYLVDQVGVSDFKSRRAIEVEGFSFVNPDYPHNGMFILDRELAAEYVATRSFDREKSRDVRPQWGLCERAAMGLCFEDPPQGFLHRYVIPVRPETLQPPCWSWVYHITNNYTGNPRVRFGKTQTNHLFSSDPAVVRWAPPKKIENIVWHMSRIAKMIRYGPPRGTGHDLVVHGLCPVCGTKEKESEGCRNPRCPVRRA